MFIFSFLLERNLLKYNILLFLYIALSVCLLIFSYGFVDKNLILSSNWFYRLLHNQLQYFSYENRVLSGIFYIFLVLGFWGLYLFLLKGIAKKLYSPTQLKKILIVVIVTLGFSFPAFSYDIFNYMLTAKVAFAHKENPWIMRPIEIPNDPSLAYTRAANKVALYGPSWILLTWLPHTLGHENIFLTIIFFKLLIIIFYTVAVWLIYLITKNFWQVSFFAFNPLVLFEVVNGAHNDIVMMVFFIVGVLLIKHNYTSKNRMVGKMIGFAIFVLSVFVKGATLIALPLLFLKRISPEKTFKCSYFLFFFVFLISPLREEMYPWYFVWCLSVVAFLPNSHKFLYGLSFAFSFGLLFRHAPYIFTREYGGINQLMRTGVTWLPVFVFLVSYVKNVNKKKS